MQRTSGGFEDKFLSKLSKLDPESIRHHFVKLLDQKQFFETIFDHLSEGVLVTGGKLNILFSNPIARRILQWPGGKRYLGEPLPARCPEGPLRELFESLLGRPRQIDNHELAHGADGRRRLSLTVIPARGAEGAGEEDSAAEDLWVILLQDVTERYQALEELSHAQRMASLARLTSGVAHEIKNPLNSLNIHAQILKSEAEDAGESIDAEKVRRASRVILEETERLTRIVDEFIQAARPQPPVLQRAQINDVIAELQRVFGPVCEREGIELRLDLEPESVAINMDSHQIFKALRNLVQNALESHLQARDSAADRPAPIISLRTRLSGDHFHVEVADNGPGIAEDSLAKIFDAFYTTKFTGTGLGLMVTDEIARAHHGRVSVESPPGAGARFILTLPLAERPIRLLEAPVAEPAADPS